MQFQFAANISMVGKLLARG